MVAEDNPYATEQESFWADSFGNEYAKRNVGEALVTANIVLFSRILASTSNVQSIIELGCNTGLCLEALKRVDTRLDLTGFEINRNAAETATAKNIAKIQNRTILGDFAGEPKADFVFTKGVLIHIDPDQLPKVYGNLHSLSKRYIMVCEYYNPTPVTVAYRGESERLFKRDFAGEMIDAYGLRLVDYGFTYHRDKFAPLDDPTWFLLEKP
jgi:pseudaminic acid biosynthesis-associated methylase